MIVNMKTTETLINDEKFIRKSFLSDDVTILLTRILFLLHFQAVDSVENTMHCRAIDYLYQTKNKKLTKQGIARTIHSNVKTLKNDRDLYAGYFFFYYSFIKSRNFTKESAIASLL